MNTYKHIQQLIGLTICAIAFTACGKDEVVEPGATAPMPQQVALDPIVDMGTTPAWDTPTNVQVPNEPQYLSAGSADKGLAVNNLFRATNTAQQLVTDQPGTQVLAFQDDQQGPNFDDGPSGGGVWQGHYFVNAEYVTDARFALHQVIIERQASAAVDQWVLAVMRRTAGGAETALHLEVLTFTAGSNQLVIDHMDVLPAALIPGDRVYVVLRPFYPASSDVLVSAGASFQRLQ